MKVSSSFHQYNAHSKDYQLQFFSEKRKKRHFDEKNPEEILVEFFRQSTIIMNTNEQFSRKKVLSR